MKKINVLFLSFYVCSCSSLYGSNHLLEESDAYKSSKTRRTNANSMEGYGLPKEILLKIFNDKPFLLPAITRLNREWHNWAKPKFKIYENLWLNINEELHLEAYPSNKEAFTIRHYCKLIFEQPIKLYREDFPRVMNVYKISRRYIQKNINSSGSLSDEDFYKKNIKKFKINFLIPSEQYFNLHTVIKNWDIVREDIFKIKLASTFWKVAENLQNLIENPSNWRTNSYYRSLHKEVPSFFTALTKSEEDLIETMFSNMNDLYQGYPHNLSVFKEVANKLIEIDKYILIKIGATNQVYTNYPSLQIMRLYQAVPLDKSIDIMKVYKTKLIEAQQAIIDFVKDSVENIDYRRAVITHHFELG